MVSTEERYARMGTHDLQKEIARLRIKRLDTGQHRADRAEDVRKLRLAQEALADKERRQMQLDRQMGQSRMDKLGTDALMLAMAEDDPDWSPHGYALHLVRDFADGECIDHKPLDREGRPRLSPGMENRLYGREVRTMPRDWVYQERLAELLELSESRTGELVQSGQIPAYRPGGKYGRGRFFISVIVAYCIQQGMPEERAMLLKERGLAMAAEDEAVEKSA